LSSMHFRFEPLAKLGFSAENHPVLTEKLWTRVLALNEARRSAGRHDISKVEQDTAISEIIEELSPPAPRSQLSANASRSLPKDYKKKLTTRVTENMTDQLSHVKTFPTTSIVVHALNMFTREDSQRQRTLTFLRR
jgi:hypothetical protein